MTERIEHTAEARLALEYAMRDVSENWPLQTGETKADIIAQAQVHATLALVEQQRIANLIAVAQMEGGPYKESNTWTRSIHDANGFYIADEDANPYIRHEIRTGLGL
jgi:hypothetical protein